MKDHISESIFNYPYWTVSRFEHNSTIIPSAGIVSPLYNITPGMLKYRVPVVVVNHLASKEYVRTKLHKLDGEIIAAHGTINNAVVAWSSHIGSTGHSMPTLTHAGQCSQCGVIVLFLTSTQLRAVLTHESMHVSDDSVMMATMHRPVQVPLSKLTIHNSIVCIARPMRVVVDSNCTLKELSSRVNKVAALASATNDFQLWNGYTLSTFKMLQYIHACSSEHVRASASIALESKSYRMALSNRIASEPITFLTADITTHNNLGETMASAEALLNSYSFD